METSWQLKALAQLGETNPLLSFNVNTLLHKPRPGLRKKRRRRRRMKSIRLRSKVL